MDYYAALIEDNFRPGGSTLTLRALSFCNLQDGALIADIGCGTGASSLLIESRCNVKVINVDPSAAASTVIPGCIQARAEALPFTDAYLDGALCECALSLSDDFGTAVRELFRALKPGAPLILSDVYARYGYFAAEHAMKHFHTKAYILSTLQSSGFRLRLFEDHSRELVKMAARLIMEGKEDLIGFPEAQKKNAGYYLLIAERP